MIVSAAREGAKIRALARNHTLVSPNEQQTGLFGVSVSGLEDVDGDGQGVIAVGAHGETEDDEGRAYIFSGATAPL